VGSECCAHTAWPRTRRGLRRRQGSAEAVAFVSDGAGGASAVWGDFHFGSTDMDIYAQHVLANGTLDARWPVNGVPVSTALGIQDAPVIVGDGSGGAIIAWVDWRNGPSDVYASRIMNSGQLAPGWP